MPSRAQLRRLFPFTYLAPQRTSEHVNIIQVVFTSKSHSEEGGQAGSHAQQRAVAQVVPPVAQQVLAGEADRRPAKRQQRSLWAQAPPCSTQFSESKCIKGF